MSPQEASNIIIDTTKPHIHIFEGPMGATSEELEKAEEMIAYDPQIQMWVLASSPGYLNILILNQPSPTGHKWSRWD